MPNIKSAVKRVSVIEKKAKENKMIASAVKTAVKKIRAEIKAGNREAAAAMLPEVFSQIDSAQSKGILHKNNAANKKSKISKSLDALNKAAN